MTHHSEKELSRFITDPGAPLDREGIEAHLASCEECRSLARAIEADEKALTDALTVAATVDEMTIADPLARMLEQAVREDEEAAQLLERMIQFPEAIAFADLPAKRKYHTAGVVRLLSRAARDLLGNRAADALILADNAIAVAEALDITAYADTLRHTLVANAWKERGNALSALCDYAAAHDAFDHTERAFRKVPHAEVELARVTLCRATVYEKSEKLNQALALASEAAEAFHRLRTPQFRIWALMVVANVRQKQGAFREARELCLELVPEAEALGDHVLAASLRQNAAWAAMELGLLDEAAGDFRTSLRVFEARGLSSYVLRARWGLARLPLLSGKPADSLNALRPILEDAFRLSLSVPAAMIILDISEALFALGRSRDVTAFVRYAVKTFERSGRADSLLTALAYLKEATRGGAEPKRTLLYLRTFVRRVEREPQLVFLPPPPDHKL
jgi:tetratricopeptide (TPR) repeat protein